MEESYFLIAGNVAFTRILPAKVYETRCDNCSTDWTLVCKETPRQISCLWCMSTISRGSRSAFGTVEPSEKELLHGEMLGYAVTDGAVCSMGRYETRTVNAQCEQCDSSHTVLCYSSMPNSVVCLSCKATIVLYKCMNCGVGWEDGDQGFITIEAPYGSIYDNLDGPSFACSSRCVVEAFQKDDFNAKGMIPKRKAH